MVAVSSDVAYLLLGVALGAIPSSALGRLMLAWFGKRLGVSPKQIDKYAESGEDTDD